MLFESSIAEQALADIQLMEDVIKHKQAFFNASYAKYEKCLNRQFQLVPGEKDLKALEKDFNAMIDAGMFYGEEPNFTNIMDMLRILEQRLNSLEYDSQK
jgi:hypothetical protein